MATEQPKVTVEELERLKQELEVLINQAHDGIFVTDAEGNLLNVNQACTTIMGLPREKILENHPVKLTEQGYLPEPVVPQVLEKKTKVTKVVTYNTGREAIVTCVPIFDGKGEISRIICNLKDLSEPRAKQVKYFRPLAEDYSKQLAELLSQGDKITFDGTIAQSPEMKEVINRALRAAQIESNALLTGETGVGKDLIARLIHQNSRRSKEGKFVKVDCAAIPAQLLEAELFGYERGAFTDARREGKAGRIELAQNGTLFLDEIGEFPLNLQVKLLNALQDRKITRVGGLQPKEVNFRLIAATNRDLEAMVSRGEFRQDLFYRLNVIRIHIPPLRERREDILAFIAYFLRIYTERYGIQKIISTQALEYLVEYDWPGNARELANVVEQLVVMTPGEVITTEDLLEIGSFQKEAFQRFPVKVENNQGKKLKEALEAYERKLISEALQRCATLREAAISLGIDLSTLVRKKKKFSL